MPPLRHPSPPRPPKLPKMPSAYAAELPVATAALTRLQGLTSGKLHGIDIEPQAWQGDVRRRKGK